MAGPGEYVADGTEGITRVEDLPKPKVVTRSRNFSRRPCPKCGHSCYRKRICERTLHDVGNLVSGRPRNIQLTDLALPKCHYTHRVVTLAVRLVVEDGLPYRAASWHLWRDHRVFVPYATIQNWVEAGGKKGAATRPRRISRRRAG
jgi:hypothetical protein